MWLRLTLSETDVRPIPGEFVGLLCRPMCFHIWWWQETCPFVYAGNWFETETYTSGIVEEIVDEDDRTWRIRVKGERMVLRATDYYEYDEGERVAVIKGWNVTTDSAFCWDDIETKTTESDAGTFESDDVVDGWTIVPASFYEN
jgi:hypothetical protein